jgi:Tfp pilus assembly protein PilX
MTHPPLNLPREERGSALIVALIMLVLLTVLALTTLNVGRTSLQIAGNAQSRAVTQAAAQQIINQVASNATFSEGPSEVLDNSNCPPGIERVPNSRCVNIYGPQGPDSSETADPKHYVRVKLAPTPACLQVRPILTTELDLTKDEDLGCTQGVNRNNFGIAGTGSISLCSNTMWEITAVGEDLLTGASSQVTQGVSLRISSDAAATSCP